MFVGEQNIAGSRECNDVNKRYDVTRKEKCYWLKTYSRAPKFVGKSESRNPRTSISKKEINIIPQ